MKRKAAFLLGLTLASTVVSRATAQEPGYPPDLLQRVRQASTYIPGPRPESVNFIKFAESHRTYAAVIEDGSDEPFISARTAFQAVYSNGFIMIDAGMDEAVHRFYGFGRDEPYWQDRNDIVQSALRRANMIVITHEHGDHVAGVLRGSHRAEIAQKTILTRAQVITLINSPQLPEIQLTEELAKDYIVVDYDELLPVAPGMVLISAPGHTPGHQMVYIQLETGAEYLLVGDIGWSIDNVSEIRLRPEATMNRIGEDPQALMSQLTWLNGLLTEKILVVPSHDNVLLTAFSGEGLLGNELTLD